MLLHELQYGLVKSIGREAVINVQANGLRWPATSRFPSLNRFLSTRKFGRAFSGMSYGTVPFRDHPQIYQSNRGFHSTRKAGLHMNLNVTYNNTGFTDGGKPRVQGEQPLSEKTAVASEAEIDVAIDEHVESLTFTTGNDGQNGTQFEDLDVDDESGYHNWVSQDMKSPTQSRNATYNRRLRKDREDMLSLVERKSSSRALRRILRPSPSLHLERALSECNEPNILPRPRPKSVHDLSYRNAKTLKIFNVNGYRHPEIDDSISLQSITAKFIRDSGAPCGQVRDEDTFRTLPADLDSNKKTKRVMLSHDESQLLQAAGYTEEDVRSWADILLEPNTELAAQRLFVPGSQHPSHEKATPWFIMNFLLRRDFITAEALRILLDHAWLSLAWQERNKSNDLQNPDQPFQLRMTMTVCIRLIRHARDVWPQALPNITKLFSTYTLEAWTKYYVRIQKSMSPSMLKELTFKSNRVLSQLSLAGRRYPVLSAVHQQRAQFDLIRRMTLHSPPLPINREGHRALTKTLLLLRKTPQERDWGSLQARSWPPFKVSKTRLDDPKDRQYGTSTAAKSLGFMRSYGYPMLNWDYIAQVYTGWNPDGSPSIQQRALTPAVPTSEAGEPDVDELHAAIITSTRTVPEAWAAFLKFDSPSSRWRAIYMAMFKKLLMQKPVEGRRPEALVHPENKPVVAGDAIEITSPPSSPLEAIYLPSEPPSVEELFDMLVDRGFPIWGGLMCLLLERAPSLDFGLKVWTAGKYPTIGVDGKVRWSADHLQLLRSHAQNRLDTLPDVPDNMIAALLGCITSTPATISELGLISQGTDFGAGSWKLRRNHSLVIASRLLVYYKPRRAAPWNYLLRALTRRYMLTDALPNAYRTKEAFWPLIAWAMSGNILRSMLATGVTPDHNSFHYLTEITWEAAIAVKLHKLDLDETRLRGAGGQTNIEREFTEARLLVSLGSTLLRRRFALLVGLDRYRGVSENHEGTSEHASMPRHLAIPKAAVLHKYVRALGTLGDHEGIYSLVQWMVNAADELHELQNTQLNGRQHMRRLIVALRVWLECPSRDFVLAERQIQIEPAAEELTELVRQEVERVEQWGGWPSDRAVDKYCNRHTNYFQEPLLVSQKRVTTHLE